MFFHSLGFFMFDICLVVLLVLADKISQNSNLIIIVFIKIESEAMPKSHLEQIIVQALLRYPDIFGGFFQRIFSLVPF